MGRPKKDVTTTNAERCKKYRAKNAEYTKKMDAMRKCLARLKAAENPTQNKMRLQKQAAAKRLQRLKKNNNIGAAQNGMPLMNFYCVSTVLLFIIISC